MSVAKQALSLARRNQGSEELKMLDTSFTAAAVAYAGLVTSITAVAQGTTVNTRTGAQIVARGVELRGLFLPNGTSVLGNQCVRVMIVADTQNVGTPPTVADILTTSGADYVGITSTINNYSALSNRFRVLYDTVLRSDADVGASPSGIVFFKHTQRLNMKIGFVGSASSDEGRNSLYVLHIASVNVNDPTLQWTARLLYTDA